MKIAVLGGYGQTGFRIARYCAHLPRFSGGEIVLLGRDTQKAAEAVAMLADEGVPCALSWSFADADDITSLRATFLDCDLVVVATGGATNFDPLLRAALLTDTDLLDILPSSPEKILFLQRHVHAAVSKGLCFITDAGILPGLPGTLARFAAARVGGTPTRLDLFASFNLDWRSVAPTSESRLALFREVLDMMKAKVWSHGAWRPARAYPQHAFTQPAGPRPTAPMLLQEIRELPPAYPSLVKAGFYVSGFGFIPDRIVMPALAAFARLFPRRRAFCANLFMAALRAFAPPLPWFHLEAEAESLSGKATFSLQSESPYDLTALAVAATVDRYLSGYRPRGLWTQSAYVDPEAFFAFLKEKGVCLDQR